MPAAPVGFPPSSSSPSRRCWGSPPALGAPALAEPDPGPGAADGEGISADRADLRRFKAGRYLVMLADPPATSYSKTKAKPGEQFDARGAGVASYSSTLKSRPDTIARDLGFQIDD